MEANMFQSGENSDVGFQQAGAVILSLSGFFFFFLLFFF